MSINVNGQEIEINEEGFLENLDQWSEDTAHKLAKHQGLTLTDKHWDAIHYLRHEYFENGSSQPNIRIMAKGMGKKWPGEKVNASALFALFPVTLSKPAQLLAYRKAVVKATTNLPAET